MTLLHGVTLGRLDRLLPDGTRETGYPTLEDQVWVGPHAVIIGGITIGQGSRIGAGAVVTESVPPGSVVVGNPSRVVRSGCQPDVVNPSVTLPAAEPLPGLRLSSAGNASKGNACTTDRVGHGTHQSLAVHSAGSRRDREGDLAEFGVRSC